MIEQDAYALVDATINVWVARHAFTLFDEFGGEPARFVYLSSNEGECCQISIDSPLSGEVAVFACAIESHDGEEMEMHWKVLVDKLDGVLEEAVFAVKQWWLR